MVKDGDPSWKPTFIVKPDGGCQGDGIYLIKDPSDIRLAGTLQSRPAVVQEYMCKPLLIDKLKFDIRLYVLLKSLDPLEIYIAKDGLSRFCTEPYQEPSSKNLHHVFMHLTNYSLNIHSSNFVHSDSTSTGSKRTFSSILCRLSSKGVDIKKVWSDIISLVIKTVIALTPELKVFYQSDIPAGRPGPTCFQVASPVPTPSRVLSLEGALCGTAGGGGPARGEEGRLLVWVLALTRDPTSAFYLLAVRFEVSDFPLLICKTKLIGPPSEDETAYGKRGARLHVFIPPCGSFYRLLKVGARHCPRSCRDRKSGPCERQMI